MNKKGFSLSINFLVTMIIMLILFGFGIYLFTTIFNFADETSDRLTKQEQSQLNDLMYDGQIVAVLNVQQTFVKDTLSYPLAISNENTGLEVNNFRIVTESCNFSSNDESLVSEVCGEGILKLADNSNGFEIENNKIVYKTMLLKPNKYNGRYTVVFHIERFESDWVQYGSKQIIWAITPN
jgi:hypothetical protein